MEKYKVFVDKGTPEGDYTVEIVVKLNENGTLEVVSYKIIK